jgi:hypothetical protein
MLRSVLDRVRQRRRGARQDSKQPEFCPWEVIAPDDENNFYQLAACLIFKNEAVYLKEWLDFHRIVGIEKFFLYDNNSTDECRQVLAPYVSEGIVTVYDFPIPPPTAQYQAYNACLKTYRRHARWIAFIDIDEFLYPREDDSLPNVLCRYEQFPAVAVNWLMFSTSSHIAKPEGLVIENYTRCQVGGNKHVRLIVDPLKTERIVSAHEAIFSDGQHAVNERKTEVHGPFSLPPSVDCLRINHYWTKSVEEFFSHKLARGDVTGLTELRNLEGLINAEKLYNSGKDDAIQRFAGSIKQ